MMVATLLVEYDMAREKILYGLRLQYNEYALYTYVSTLLQH